MAILNDEQIRKIRKDVSNGFNFPRPKQEVVDLLDTLDAMCDQRDALLAFNPPPVKTVTASSTGITADFAAVAQCGRHEEYLGSDGVIFCRQCGAITGKLDGSKRVK